jgi:hypothetical protein
MKGNLAGSEVADGSRYSSTRVCHGSVGKESATTYTFTVVEDVRTRTTDTGVRTFANAYVAPDALVHSKCVSGASSTHGRDAGVCHALVYRFLSAASVDPSELLVFVVGHVHSLSASPSCYAVVAVFCTPTVGCTLSLIHCWVSSQLVTLAARPAKAIEAASQSHARTKSGLHGHTTMVVHTTKKCYKATKPDGDSS